jgi:hypothetical protein
MPPYLARGLLSPRLFPLGHLDFAAAVSGRIAAADLCFLCDWMGSRRSRGPQRAVRQTTKCLAAVGLVGSRLSARNPTARRNPSGIVLWDSAFHPTGQ